MMKKIQFVLLYIFISLTEKTFAYPISPRPLRQLVIESESIVIGYVVKTYNKNKEGADWFRNMAKIVILEKLQGSIKDDTIEIIFYPGMICPAPEIYYDSTLVISFIDEFDGSYYTHAHSYGAKTLTKEEIAIYKNRIQEIQKIQKIANKEEQLTNTVDWLVKCAEIETTRWEGIFELMPESDFMSIFSIDKNQNFRKLLTEEHRERLKKALLKTKEINYREFGLVDLLYKGNKSEIEDFLIIRLKDLKEDNYWFADEYFNRLKHRSKSESVKLILEQFESIEFKNRYRKEIRKIIEDFLILVEA